MTSKQYIFSLLCIFLVFCLAFSFVQAVSATKYSVIDNGFSPVKDSNDTILHWKVYSSNKKTIIYNNIVKGNSTFSNKKISIKKIDNKLIINTKNFNKGDKTEKNSSINTKLSLNSYYFKVYQPKMLENIVTKKIIDSGGEPLSNVAHGDIHWKSYILHGKKILVLKNFHSLVQDINTTTLIEKFGKNKLKIFTQIDSSISNGENSKEKSTVYVETSLNPNEYYFQVFKPKMLKYVLRDQILERAFGLLKESETKLFWNTHIYLNKNFIKDKLTINRGFSHTNLTYDKITIEIFSKNKLKITYEVNKTLEITYINTKLSPLDYYYNIYRSEMIEIFNKSTIGYYAVVN